MQEKKNLAVFLVMLHLQFQEMKSIVERGVGMVPVMMDTGKEHRWSKKVLFLLGYIQIRVAYKYYKYTGPREGTINNQTYN